MSVPLWVEVFNKLATPAIAGVSVFYVFLQYQRAQRWKASDLAITLLDRLNTDPSLALACHALDWGIGPLIVPEQYRTLFPADSDSKTPYVVAHDPAVLASALEPQLNARTVKDPKGMVYRLCFDKFFSYLDTVHNHLSKGQLHVNDISELKYWLVRLCDYQYAPERIKGTQVFQPALDTWGYKNVMELCKKLGAC